MIKGKVVYDAKIKRACGIYTGRFLIPGDRSIFTTKNTKTGGRVVHFPQTELDEWVIMPNHVHGIVSITMNVDGDDGIARAKNFSPLRDARDDRPLPHGTSKTIGSIVRGFKIGVTKWMRQNTNVFIGCFIITYRKIFNTIYSD